MEAYMAKTILKEAGIVLLLLVAIALILGIILYAYIVQVNQVKIIVIN